MKIYLRFFKWEKQITEQDVYCDHIKVKVSKDFQWKEEKIRKRPGDTYQAIFRRKIVGTFSY